jgi:hypothetical protein
MPTIIASEEIFVIFIGFIGTCGFTPDEFDTSIQRTEESNFDAYVEAFESQFRCNGMLESIRKIWRSIENSAIINVCHIDLNRVIFSHCHLRRFYCHTTLSSDATCGYFCHSTQ